MRMTRIFRRITEAQQLGLLSPGVAVSEVIALSPRTDLDIGCGIEHLRHRPGPIGVAVNPRTVEWCRRNGLKHV